MRLTASAVSDRFTSYYPTYIEKRAGQLLALRNVVELLASRPRYCALTAAVIVVLAEKNFAAQLYASALLDLDGAGAPKATPRIRL